MREIDEAVAVEVADDGDTVAGAVAGTDAVEANDPRGGLGVRRRRVGAEAHLDRQIVEIEVAQILEGDPELARRVAPGRDGVLRAVLVERVDQRIGGIAVGRVEDLLGHGLAAIGIDQAQMVGLGEDAARRRVADVDKGQIGARERAGRAVLGAIGDQEETEAGAGSEALDAIERAQRYLGAERCRLGVGEDDLRIDEAAILADLIDAERVLVACHGTRQRDPSITGPVDGQHRRVGAVDQGRIERLAIDTWWQADRASSNLRQKSQGEFLP